jgi:hypothetical protein
MLIGDMSRRREVAHESFNSLNGHAEERSATVGAGGTRMCGLVLNGASLCPEGVPLPHITAGSVVEGARAEPFLGRPADP